MKEFDVGCVRLVKADFFRWEDLGERKSRSDSLHGCTAWEIVFGTGDASEGAEKVGFGQGLLTLNGA